MSAIAVNSCDNCQLGDGHASRKAYY